MNDPHTAYYFNTVLFTQPPDVHALMTETPSYIASFDASTDRLPSRLPSRLLEETAALKPQQPAPSDYYQKRFDAVFSTVLNRYADVIDDGLSTRMRSFRNASSEGQRLFARLLMRQTLFQYRHKLSYTEVGDCERAIQDLANLGLLESVPAIPADGLLQKLTSAELRSVYPQAWQQLLACTAKTQNRPKKTTFICYLLGAYSDTQIRTRLGIAYPWIRIAAIHDWETVKLLYFGNRHDDWATFIRVDLGQLKYEPIRLGARLYDSPASLQEHAALSHLRGLIHRLGEYPALNVPLYRVLAKPAQYVVNEPLRDRCILRLAQWLERAHYYRRATEAYRLLSSPPSRERQIRLLDRTGFKAEATAMLQQTSLAPLNAQERLFTQRYKRRGGGFQPAIQEIHLNALERRVEQCVIQHEIDHNGALWGVHAENVLVKTLTGLRFWNALFASRSHAFTHPFQFAPHDFYSPTFFHERKQIIVAIEAATATREQLHKQMRAVMLQKHGVANPLVSWGWLQHVPLDLLLEAVPWQVINQLSSFLIRNLGDFCTGFPDLMMVYPSQSSGKSKNHAAQIRLLEVKGPGDQLQSQQRAWLQVLADLDIEAHVAKVRLDKSQRSEFETQKQSSHSDFAASGSNIRDGGR